MIDYFLRKQQDDPDLFFSIEPDENSAARNIFWVDGCSRRAYQVFGDVVLFDTTYQTNKYSMPMGPFIGVNHHRQSIFFGCALIRDEKKTTFFWLFTTWLQAMGGKKPQVIMTDQDLAMRVAIEKVFGADTIHRSCLWHVMRKARDHLGVLYGAVQGFKDEFFAVIKFSWTIADFEANWQAFLKKYKVDSNPYLKIMYDRRDEWAPVYFCDTFCASMSTTQRSESINAVTKIWMGSNTSLYDFATKFEKMVQGVYERESDEDIRTINEVPQLWSCDPIEAEARKVYTRTMFSLFKAKLKKCTAYRVCEIEKGKLYEVHPARSHLKYKWYKPNRLVHIDKINGRVDCECKGFEVQGLLCPHALEVMRHVEMEPLLPTHYILKRWSCDANESIKRSVNENRVGKDMESVMVNAINQRIQIIIKEAVKSCAAYDMVCTRLDELKEGVVQINKGITAETTTTQKAHGIPHEVQQSLRFHDPPVSQCKGKRKPQRLKHPNEAKDAKKMRTCSFCHKKEGHNMSTCPKRMKAQEHEVDIETDNSYDSEDLSLD